MKLAGLCRFDMKAKVKGGGLSGQLDALKYGIARALQKQDPSYRGVLKAGALPARASLRSVADGRVGAQLVC